MNRSEENTYTYKQMAELFENDLNMYYEHPKGFVDFFKVNKWEKYLIKCIIADLPIDKRGNPIIVDVCHFDIGMFIRQLNETEWRENIEKAAKSLIERKLVYQDFHGLRLSDELVQNFKNWPNCFK